MANFPNSPTVGNVYNVGGIDFLCTGTGRFKPIQELNVYDSVATMKLGINPAGHRAQCVRYYASGAVVADLNYISRGIGWPITADGFVNHVDSKGNFLELIAGDTVDIRAAGADPTIADNAPNINALLSVFAGHTITGSNGTFIIRALLVTNPNTVIKGEGRNFWLKKGANTDMINLAKNCQLINVRFDGDWATYSGAGVIINTGDNTPVVADQGNQLIERCQFINMKDYPIKYTAANKGWMSIVSKCRFTNYDSLAAVLWPDEPANGGNRSVQDCYSNAPIVNVNGCDNGFVKGCTMGGTPTINQGVVFPSGTTNRAKKVIISGNRFGIGGGNINIRGADLVFSDNITAGNIELMSNASNDGCVNSSIFNKVITGSFTDNSNAVNYVDQVGVPFTPTWTSAGTPPVFGNADVRCSFTRKDNVVTARYYIIFGSTTTFGSGGWQFTLPVNRATGVNTDFCGSAIGRAQVLGVRTIAQIGFPNSIQLTTASGSLVDASTPGAWAAGDALIINIQYQIF